MIKDISRGSRPCCRHHPQFLEDCSAAICPFSNSATGIPRSASVSAAHTPMMPPPIMMTSVSCGTSLSVGTWSGIGGMRCGSGNRHISF